MEAGTEVRGAPRRHGAARGGGFPRARADRGARRRRAAARFHGRRQSRERWKRAPGCRATTCRSRASRAATECWRRASHGLTIENVRFREIAGFAVLVSRSPRRRDRSRAGARQRIAQSGRAQQHHRRHPAGRGHQRFPCHATASCAISAATASGRTRSTLRRAMRAASSRRIASRPSAATPCRWGTPPRCGWKAIAARASASRWRTWTWKAAPFRWRIDTAGNVDRSIYTRQSVFDEINGKCIDLDGFHDGEVRGTCAQSWAPERTLRRLRHRHEQHQSRTCSRGMCGSKTT